MASFPSLGLCVIFTTLSLVISAPVKEVQCGTSDYPGNHAGERIIHGTVVPQGKYPWLAQLDPIGCTATIISRRYILTAAHCVLDCTQACEDCELICNPLPDDYQMIATVGSVNKSEGQKIGVKRMIPHDNHSVDPNDIGIIELEEELNFTKDIRPICLSGKQQYSVQNGQPVGDTCQNWTGFAVCIQMCQFSNHSELMKQYDFVAHECEVPPVIDPLHPQKHFTPIDWTNSSSSEPTQEPEAVKTQPPSPQGPKIPGKPGTAEVGKPKSTNLSVIPPNSMSFKPVPRSKPAPVCHCYFERGPNPLDFCGPWYAYVRCLRACGGWNEKVERARADPMMVDICGIPSKAHRSMDWKAVGIASGIFSLSQILFHAFY
ncbi:trypsin domain-containing protein [Ditylenchus destructor]|nr:trypsin domain-containing protein [Ditylenchus destructor]